ncbi:hypothetical protein BpHYR1_029150 [Brachionus plicatilis]|uniref:Uncharacterized protein n=1 Tax=Brachionus plicatilis TaxID=10195 RepID=A0A3M7PUU0_BRAPC|nr:hypothetical protein BpHYR1_029150 [Brachionus plicatilis]
MDYSLRLNVSFKNTNGTKFFCVKIYQRKSKSKRYYEKLLITYRKMTIYFSQVIFKRSLAKNRHLESFLDDFFSNIK